MFLESGMKEWTENLGATWEQSYSFFLYSNLSQNLTLEIFGDERVEFSGIVFKKKKPMRKTSWDGEK